MLVLIISLILCINTSIAYSFDICRDYELWYKNPAPNRGADMNSSRASGFPYDEDWEHWSLPIGNGFMGATIFGRTDTERIQLSEKTLANRGCYNNGGFTNFAEIYLDFSHSDISNYKRSLSLNNATASVAYNSHGIFYEREYFANYPSNVIAVKIKSNQRNKVSFTIRPEIPYLNNSRKGDNRTGKVMVYDDLLVLSGIMEYFDVKYEAQLKVVNYGGNLISVNGHNSDFAKIKVVEADSVVMFLTAGTSYNLNEDLFLLPHNEKCKGNISPHKAISERINRAVDMGYDEIKKEHLNDYKKLFDRVSLQLCNEIPDIPTDSLVYDYKNGIRNSYLEELYFHYGRYLLISSSREGTLPANLQGAWTQYDYSPWSGGYWHNINVQMNYWPAFVTNLSETFKSFVDYTEAYRKAALKNASNYIQRNNPAKFDKSLGANGWTIGTDATAYGISEPGWHSGPGTGGFTTKLYWDYYDFTRDITVLEKHVYPALEGMARFLSKTLKPDNNGHLLVDPSFSPENIQNGEPVKTIGCTFDQGMIWENFNDLLKAADILRINSIFLDTIRTQIRMLDPVLIGKSGQLKEYREEEYYSDLGEADHRHISHLCLLYPGTLINNSSQNWMNAARKALECRGIISGPWVGWPLAHRLNCWARLQDGDMAYKCYQTLLEKGVLENLWGNCPPFQIDSNFGATAGVAEMLLQSHEGYINILPSKPIDWKDGRFSGLVARGNFVIDVEWGNNKLRTVRIHSRIGGDCILYYNDMNNLKILNSRGKVVKFKQMGDNKVMFNSSKGETYYITMGI